MAKTKQGKKTQTATEAQLEKKDQLRLKFSDLIIQKEKMLRQVRLLEQTIQELYAQIERG